MPTLADNALTSLDNAKLWLRRNNVVSADDDAILTLTVNSISNAIQRYTGRQFVPEDDVTKIFEYEGGGHLRIDPYELRSITSVTMNGQTLATTTGIGDGDYAAYPRNKTADGTYLYLTLKDIFRVYPSNSLNAPVLNERDVTIVGDWGMSEVPADVELACLIAVADLYRNPEQGQQRGQGEFLVVEAPANPGSDESLPFGATRLLDPFIRPQVG